MRTTLNLDGDLIKKAQKAIGIYEKTALIHLGLRALLQNEAYKRMLGFLGSEKKAKYIKRRKVSL